MSNYQKVDKLHVIRWMKTKKKREEKNFNHKASLIFIVIISECYPPTIFIKNQIKERRIFFLLLFNSSSRSIGDLSVLLFNYIEDAYNSLVNTRFFLTRKILTKRILLCFFPLIFRRSFNNFRNDSFSKT